MIGISSGVYTRFKLLVPNLILIKYVCHFLQLAVSAAAKVCVPRNLEFLIPTRWLSIASAVLRVQEQWVELKLDFNIMKDEDKCYTAHMLYGMYNDDTNYAYICFLKSNLEDVLKVNKAFEANSDDPTKLLEDLSLFLHSLIKKIATPNTKFKLFVADIESFLCTFNTYLGYRFETKIRETKQAGFIWENNLWQRCVQFLTKLMKETIQKVPENIDGL
nr:unnamed protein product [Callosobruchus analis]